MKILLVDTGWGQRKEVQAQGFQGNQINLLFIKIFGFSSKLLTIPEKFATLAALEYPKCHLSPNPAPVVHPHSS
jgi:hypothetical protein